MMIHLSDIWQVISRQMVREQWVSLDHIYRLVELHGNLDSEDSDSSLPKWKRNVRNLLQHKKATGEILWNGQGALYDFQSSRCWI